MKPTRLYSISVMATKNDNGYVETYFTREAAEKARLELLTAGVYHVSSIW